MLQRLAEFHQRWARDPSQRLFHALFPHIRRAQLLQLEAVIVAGRIGLLEQPFALLVAQQSSFGRRLVFGVAAVEERAEYGARLGGGQEVADVATDEAFDFVAGQFGAVAEAAQQARRRGAVQGCGCLRGRYGNG